MEGWVGWIASVDVVRLLVLEEGETVIFAFLYLAGCLFRDRLRCRGLLLGGSGRPLTRKGCFFLVFLDQNELVDGVVGGLCDVGASVGIGGRLALTFLVYSVTKLQK